MDRQLQFEFWMPVIGYEGLYEASDLGRLRSLDYNHTGKVRVLKPAVNDTGHLRITLVKHGVKKNLFVHRLVFEAFFGPISEGIVIDHINTNPSDNRLSNLRACTQNQNLNNPITKVRRISAVKKIMGKPVFQLNKETEEVIKKWECMMDVQRELGINCSNLSNCCSGKKKTAGGFRWRFA